MTTTLCALLTLLGAACDEQSTRSDDASVADAGLNESPDGSSPAEDAGALDAGDPDAGPAPRRLGVNDVSYLFPLPGEGQGELLALSDQGDHGVLLPESLFDAHIQRLWEGPSVEMGYAASHVTAMRLDPCGGQTAVTDPASCESEVRLSAQPTFDGSSAIDAAIHLIYRLPRAELDDMLAELLALKASSTLDVAALPLGPHPIMLEQGLGGSFARGVQQTILRHVGEDRLVKFTFMDRGRNSSNWRFHQLERTGETFAATIIPGTEDVQQGVDENGVQDSRMTSVHPLDEAIGYPNDLLDSERAQTLSASAQQAALNRLSRFEDPGQVSSLTLDCGSCHVNTNARAFFETLFGLTAEGSFIPPAGQNVTRSDQSELFGNVLLSFGYFGERVVVSQRVINESARVADWLSRRSL